LEAQEPTCHVTPSAEHFGSSRISGAPAI
jgi:hypothetical protein